MKTRQNLLGDWPNLTKFGLGIQLDDVLRGRPMARVLPDREIKKLIGTVIVGADESLLDPNGIKLRLGSHVLFFSTGEEKKVDPGQYLTINPGESVMICSLEKIDFRSDTIQKLFPNSNLMALITPTTTMMREGVTQAATKIDTGFSGDLNWGLRNNSHKNLLLGYGEPMFKLTIFELDKGESPELAYGKRGSDTYQETEGIRRSTRRIPADIPKSKIVSSTVDKLDPQKALREAGYPFNHVSTELVALHGKWEVVSKDVSLLASKLDEQMEKVERLFDRKFFRVAGVIIAALPIMYGIVTFLQSASVQANIIGVIAVVSGVLIGVVAWLFSKSNGRRDN